jgi:hypothetical protein
MRPSAGARRQLLPVLIPNDNMQSLPAVVTKKSMNGQVQRLNLSADGLRALTMHERFVFALAGHVFNELMLMQKLMHISRRPPEDVGPLADGSVGTSLFILRVLVAKTYEALHSLSRPDVKEELIRNYFPKVDGLADQWEATVRRYKQLPWMATIRNQGAFHYLNMSQWAPHLSDEYCDGAYVLVGKRYSDTLFHWAEMSAALPAMTSVNPEHPFEGLDKILEEMGALLGKLTDCLARGVQAFITSRLMEGPLSDPIEFEAPDFDKFRLPYFYAQEPTGA